MSISKKKDSPYWHTRFSIAGLRVQESTKTTSRTEAQEYEEKRRKDIREQLLLGKKPKKSWSQAVLRWCDEMKHKRSFKTDLYHFRWLQPHLEDYALNDIDKTVIERIASLKEKDGVSPSTINRVLQAMRAVLNRAYRQWEWIDRVPVFHMRHVNNKRIRFLTQKEAKALLAELPPHLNAMTRFTLATGLRMSNVCRLQWSQINMQNKHVVIWADQSKNKKSFGVPLNKEAIAVLKEQLGKHHEYVFVYLGQPVRDANTPAWGRALKRAGISDFRWHDLRHTWASWHVQNGTSLQELFELGGWSSFEMVLRYAHLSSSHLKKAAQRVSGADLVKSGLKVIK